MPERPFLTAGPLTAFAFGVESALGRRPLRYLVARRFTGDTALTCLYVLEPEQLAGTYLTISEDRAGGDCQVWTYVPTMRRAVRIVERHVFGCLPLTQVGYLDLMAWRHPALGDVPEDREADVSWSGWPGAEARCYLGPASMPGLTVTEAVDPVSGTVVARSVDRRGVPERRWQVLEPGPPELPARIGVRRPDAGAATEFRRLGDPVEIPEGVFDEEPRALWDAVGGRIPALAPAR
ncbi:LolA-like protein [Actinomadura harenae]|uniref:Uncharacterized protein n=1 Tax=Actinomadura harenae TaxID=2483351 RepID=A0A3M2LA84_9ACTN|nr:hypothetical protein [Actinomadura harenae]RMI34512.1 hypothetical protein EBO15_40950 [Actinomadura harenae]